MRREAWFIPEKRDFEAIMRRFFVAAIFVACSACQTSEEFDMHSSAIEPGEDSYQLLWNALTTDE